MVRVVIPIGACADRLAAMDREIFGPAETPWTAEDFRAIGGPPGGAVIVDDVFREGLIILRMAADEAEILNLGVARAARRQGLGRALLEMAEDLAAARGTVRIFLEVAADNTAARALYADAGYAQIGTRPAYYRRPGGVCQDALVLSKTL